MGTGEEPWADSSHCHGSPGGVSELGMYEEAGTTLGVAGR